MNYSDSNYPLSSFNRYKMACSLSDDPTERWEIQRSIFLQNLNAQRERELLIEEIVKRVLERISVRADTKDAVSKIESLQKAVDGLTQNRG